ncbi:general secretion pathway protein GspB [Agaribacter flavus]|uniref:General secretion pathway protein GspB n=1 Tax=Agaribacter flavus TaxID=1902781 RepID=A0ABV7FMH4_9ALTE
MHKQLSINDLKPGMMVTTVLEQNGPVKIRKVGLVKSPEMIKGLAEMGVITLEVDFSQSISIEEGSTASSEATAATTQAQNGKSSLTPTKRLMENDQQVERVDRQLSQQFHNSLFMSAIEEMPSHFTLYAKPIGFLVVCAVFGFGLGFSAMQTPKLVALWQSQDNTSSDLAESLAIEPSDDKRMLAGVESNSKQAIPNPIASNMDSGEVEESTIATTEKTEPHASPVTERAITASPNQYANTVNSNNGGGESDQQIAYVNGVPLQSGEIVLGYQGEAAETKPSNDGNEQPSQNQGGLSGIEAIESETGGRVINQSSLEQSSASPDLMRRLNAAIVEIDNSAPNIPIQNTVESQESYRPTDVIRVDDLPINTQNSLPSMSFSAHMYASSPDERWVRVNGLRRQESDFITDDLQIIEIRSDRVILDFRGDTFYMNALSDW